MTQHEWYYAVAGNQMGPVGTDELKGLAASGELKPTALVWRDGLSEWMPASQIPGLFAASAAAPLAAGAMPAPYRAGASPTPPAAAAVLPYGGGGSYGGAGVTARAVDLLGQTRPWVLFLAILAFIIAGLMVLGGVAMFFVGLMGSMNTRAAGPMGAFGAGVGLVYVAFALLYFVPGLYLMRYASRIAQLRGSGRTEDLEGALEAQKSFWKFVGIAVLVVICLYVAIVAIAVVIGVMS